MKILHIYLKIIFLLALFLLPASCGEKIEQDPCQLTHWNLPKEFEIKLAVRVTDSNPLLTGGAPGSQKPSDFEEIQVNGNLVKGECNDSKSEPVYMGNTYLIKGVDETAPLNEAGSYWIGHVVYVYEFDNDNDYLDITLTVKITMEDGQSYVCDVTNKVDYNKILLVPDEMYYYILVDIYSDSWVKV